MADRKNFNLGDYVEVHERMAAFFAAYPDGSLQTEIAESTETRVTVKAYAYRKPDDPRPGIGHSWLEVPGHTPYTRGSELENAETSAWGRALAAVGIEVKRGVGTQDEIRNKQREGDDGDGDAGTGGKAPPPPRGPNLKDSVAEINAWLMESGINWSSPAVAEVLGEPVTRSNVQELLGQWLGKPGQNVQSFKSRVGDLIRSQSAS